MSVPIALANFPNSSVVVPLVFDFNKINDIGEWEWTGTGHSAPDGLTDQDGGAITLGSGSANANDFIQGQVIGSTIQLNRLSKVFQFTWKAQLSSASKTKALLGVCITNPDLMDTNITDGFGFYTNGVNWNTFLAFDSVTQYTTYSQQLSVQPCDTLVHTFAIRIITDPNTVGAGQVAFFIDGVQVGATQVFATAALPYDEKLRISIASGNVDASANSMIVDQVLSGDQS